MKKFYAIMAFVSALLSGCYIMKDNSFVASCWALSSICYIIMFVLRKTKDKDEEE